MGFLALAGTALGLTIALGAGFAVAAVQRRSRNASWAAIRAYRIACSATPVAVVAWLAVAALLWWDLRLDYRMKELLDDAAPAIPVLALAGWAIAHRLMWRRLA